MNRNRFNKNAGSIWGTLRTTVLPILLFVAVIGLFGMGLTRVNSTTKSESLKQSQAALSRVVTVCYAIEGRYPPSVEYMREQYGLAIDGETYIIHYNCFASNIAPEMWVQERYF